MVRKNPDSTLGCSIFWGTTCGIFQLTRYTAEGVLEWMLLFLCVFGGAVLGGCYNATGCVVQAKVVTAFEDEKLHKIPLQCDLGPLPIRLAQESNGEQWRFWMWGIANLANDFAKSIWWGSKNFSIKLFPFPERLTHKHEQNLEAKVPLVGLCRFDARVGFHWLGAWSFSRQIFIQHVGRVQVAANRPDSGKLFFAGNLRTNLLNHAVYPSQRCFEWTVAGLQKRSLNCVDEWANMPCTLRVGNWNCEVYETWDLYKFPKSVFNILASFQVFAERTERTLAGSFTTLVSTSPKSECEKPEKAWVKEKPPQLVFGAKSRAVFSPNAVFFLFGRYQTHTSEKMYRHRYLNQPAF